MTLRACTIQLCRELGMGEEELEAFIADQDASAPPEHLMEVSTRTLEELDPFSQQIYMAGMRTILTRIVDKWRKKQAQRQEDE